MGHGFNKSSGSRAVKNNRNLKLPAHNSLVFGVSCNMDRFSEKVAFIVTALLSLFSLWFCYSDDAINFLWVIISAYFIILFAVSIWRLFDLEYEPLDENRKPDQINESKSNGQSMVSQIRLARHNHLNGEITRYRDLSWQITAFCWAIYFSLYWFHYETKEHFPRFTDDIFLACLVLTAIFGTIFLLFCEHTANRNRRQRREMEESLGLDFQWRHKIYGESLSRPGFWISVGIFFVVVWAPPLAMFYFSKKVPL